MTSPGPAFQECTGSCHENVPAPKVASNDKQSTDGLTVLAKIEIGAMNHPTTLHSHAVIKKLSNCQKSVRLVILCVAYATERLFSIVSTVFCALKTG